MTECTLRNISCILDLPLHRLPFGINVVLVFGVLLGVMILGTAVCAWLDIKPCSCNRTTDQGPR